MVEASAQKVRASLKETWQSLHDSLLESFFEEDQDVGAEQELPKKRPKRPYKPRAAKDCLLPSVCEYSKTTRA